MNEISFPECGLCDGMRICQCQKVDNRRFIAACHAMQALLLRTDIDTHSAIEGTPYVELISKGAIHYADALLEELERK